jgi:hypothetical protein
MSEQEKFEAQGRAHAALRQAKSNVAILTVSLQETARGLRELSGWIDAFGEPGKSRSASEIENRLRQLSIERGMLQIGELHEEAAKVRLLQEQIDQF